MEQLAEMIVGMLGIMKAGKHVHLDPEYPTDRLSFMLDDGGARSWSPRWVCEIAFPAIKEK